MSISPQESEKLLETASAKALLIMWGGDIWAKAGVFRGHDFETFEIYLQRYWPVSPTGDINRYVGFTLNGEFYFLYAKYIFQGEYLIGLIFPQKTPLVRIRQDMTNIIKSILSSGTLETNRERRLEQSLQFTLKPSQKPDSELISNQNQAGWRKEIVEPDKQDEDQVPFNQPENSHAKDDKQCRRNHSFDVPLEIPSIGSDNLDMDLVMEDVPWQAVEPLLQAGDENQLTAVGATTGEGPFHDMENETQQVQSKTWQPLNELTQGGVDLVSILQDSFEIDQGLGGGDVNPLPSKNLQKTPEHERPIALFADTQPVAQDVNDVSSMSDVSDVTFYLVPQLDEHYLLGELSHWMRRWLPAICETYGWQLDFLSVRPNYIKWTLADFPETLIREMLSIVRRMTSERIFRIFPELQKGNPTQDFWSSGYLVDLQNKDYSTKVLISKVSKSRL